MLQLVVIVRETMSRAFLWLGDAALVGHAGKCQFVFLPIKMILDHSNGGAHGVNQWIGEWVIPLLAHYQVKQFQRRQKDPQTTSCTGGEHNIFPTIPVLLHFTYEEAIATLATFPHTFSTDFQYIARWPLQQMARTSFLQRGLLYDGPATTF